ncbi:protein YkpC [Metabacillus herbersteinensis]|uniref:Protein YkpC n=1 Tax=Metabacillus herbersteinensis TaxID=283816 RepID=A0ABV6GCW4_9BACI
MKDLSRRMIISLTLASIILGGMSVTFANMPPSSTKDYVTVEGK